MYTHLKFLEGDRDKTMLEKHQKNPTLVLCNP